MTIPLVLVTFVTLFSEVWSFLGLNEGKFVILPVGLLDLVGLGVSLEFSSKGVGAPVVVTKTSERVSEGAAVGVLVGALVATSIGTTVGLREGTEFKE